MDSAPELDGPRAGHSREALAKAWLLEILDATPLAEAKDVPVDWLSEEAPALIDEILAGIATGDGREFRLSDAGADRLQELCGLRGVDAPQRLPRDLAALQTLLVETLRTEVPERRLSGFAGAVGRLATAFGDIQGRINEQLVAERSGGAADDPVTGLPGEAQLHEWLRILLAEERRYGHPFALALIDVEGLRHVNEAHGRAAGDRVLASVAGLVREHIRAVDRAFRLGGDELCLLVPHGGSQPTRRMMERLCEQVDRLQQDTSPRVAIAAGVAACPEHGNDAGELLAAAEEAAYAAKASGLPVDGA